MSIKMTVRPRLWRLGALAIYIVRTAPLFAIMWSNIINAFLPAFLNLQKRENWRRRS